MVKPKKQYLIRAPDNSFKILLNMIMGIQIAVQSTPNYDINPEKEDLTKYLNKMSYSIQTTNFGLKKQETFYLREYAGIIFNNIRHTWLKLLCRKNKRNRTKGETRSNNVIGRLVLSWTNK